MIILEKLNFYIKIFKIVLYYICKQELKAAEEERKAQLKAEKERAKKEALLLKRMKESRQRRAEERRRAIEGLIYLFFYQPIYFVYKY